jgi:hypothetical protein
MEIAPYTPRHAPPTEKPSQLIPKKPPIRVKILTINTCEGPDETIHYIPEGNYKSEFPHTNINLLHYPFIPHDQDAP